MDIFAAIIVILFVFFILRGAWRGFSGELAPLAGIIVCIGILWYGYSPIHAALKSAFPSLDPGATLFYSAIAVTVAGCLGFLIVSLLIRKLFSLILPQPFNALLGALIGAVKVGLFISIIGGLFTMGKTRLQEVRNESERNPFTAMAVQFWSDRLSALKQSLFPQNEASIAPTNSDANRALFEKGAH